MSVRRFACQMAWLKWMGYHVLSLDEYIRHRVQRSSPPPYSVVITIDDGYMDNFTLAYPVLHRYNFPATIFVASEQIGGTYHSEVQSELNGRQMLSWSDIERMKEGGIQFGAHTRTHPDLTNISARQAWEEIDGSKFDLERKLKVPIHFFSYPFGKFDAKTQTLVQQAGFIGSCSVNTGLNTPMTPLLALHRVEIRGTDSLLQFALAVCFGERSHTLRERLLSSVARMAMFCRRDKMRNRKERRELRR